MAIAFIAVSCCCVDTPRGALPDARSATVPGPRPSGPRGAGGAALFYNIGFFVLLAFSPFPLGFDALGIGLTFFGWGVGLAIT